MRRSRTLVAVAAAAAVALSGCSATITGSPAPTGASTSSGGGAVAPTTDPVAWTDKVCGSLLPLQDSLSAKPQFDENDPAAAVKALSDFLGKSEASIDQAISGLDAAGPSPVANGDPAVAKIKSALTTIRSSFDQAKVALDKIDPNNVSELVTALPQAVAPLQELSKLQDPTTDLQSSPELEAAAAKAPNCQALKKNS
jgi:predicted small secreted protein